ncbi:MAG TPA: hypothetical protein EYH45_07045 [Candidatus Caldiarchaeum subterraneum]|uniref:Beta-ribofuranosylaminobenzene 5'-phosphate synthase n=1 Tax=Caldiarchaeum subterraneum TaxID=311458 RepID=A0A833ECJ1_CALS0|nr:hypothetical protein [Candidatus Caldarchaeum subterraneum]
MKVRIEAGGRIHLGIIDLDGGLGRIYGSIGLAIQEPKLILEAESSKKTVVEAPEEVKPIVMHVISSLNHNAYINMVKHLPPHKGLGATTQTILATAVALSKLYQLNLDVDNIAEMFGRGRISKIGIEAFKTGGFIINAPIRKNVDEMSKTVMIQNFPEEWIVILAIPKGEVGYSEEYEKEVFKKLPRPPSYYADKICRLILVKLIPALLDKELEEFGSALEEIQKLVGEQFKPIQGRVIASRKSQEILEQFRKYGLTGLGQSSWGPAVYGFTDSRKEAVECIREIGEKFPDTTFIITRARNSGAEIIRV